MWYDCLSVKQNYRIQQGTYKKSSCGGRGNRKLCFKLWLTSLKEIDQWWLVNREEILYLCTRGRVYPHRISIFLKETGGLILYYSLFGNLQTFALVKKQVFSSFSGNSDCEDVAGHLFPTGACSRTALESEIFPQLSQDDVTIKDKLGQQI